MPDSCHWDGILQPSSCQATTGTRTKPQHPRIFEVDVPRPAGISTDAEVAVLTIKDPRSSQIVLDETAPGAGLFLLCAPVLQTVDSRITCQKEKWLDRWEPRDPGCSRQPRRQGLEPFEGCLSWIVSQFSWTQQVISLGLKSPNRTLISLKLQKTKKKRRRKRKKAKKKSRKEEKKKRKHHLLPL